MQPGEILALYDVQMRRDRFSTPTQRVEKTAHTTRVLGDVPDAEFGSVVYSRLTEETAESIISSEMSYFAGIGRAFEWKVYGHDLPGDLEDRLLEKGFRPCDPESLLCVSPVNPFELAPPSGIEIKKISDPGELEAIAAIDVAAGSGENIPLLHELGEELAKAPQSISLYVAWAGTLPVAKAWVRFYENRAFADLWGGETLREYRHKGIYRSLVSIRWEEARRRGVRFMMTDALPSSRPILEKLGFERLTSTTPYLWVPLQ